MTAVCLHSVVPEKQQVSRCLKGCCSTRARVACVTVDVREVPPFSPPLKPRPLQEPFTWSSCWWICCSWKRRLAHQNPIPARSKSVSPPRSKPVCDTPGGILVWSGKQKAQEGGEKKPLLRIIAGNSFNGSRWKTALNAGGNFANYCSMHLSNLILRLPPCVFPSLCRFFPLLLHSWVVHWHTLICYTPIFLDKKKERKISLGDLTLSNSAAEAVGKWFQ